MFCWSGGDHKYATEDTYKVLDAINKYFNEMSLWACHHIDTDPKEYLPGLAGWLKKALSEYIDAELKKHLHFIDSDSVNEEK